MHVCVVYLFWPRAYAMEVIVDELQKNNVDVDVQILSQHIHYVLGVHEDLYNEMANCLNSNELLNVFNETNVNSFGCVVAYLALVYQMNISEEDAIREAVCLVVPVLRDTARVEGSFIQRICSGVGCALYERSIS